MVFKIFIFIVYSGPKTSGWENWRSLGQRYSLIIIPHYFKHAMHFNIQQTWASKLLYIYQRRIQSSVKRLMTFFVEIVNVFQSLTIFAKKLYIGCLARFWICLYSVSHKNKQTKWGKGKTKYKPHKCTWNTCKTWKQPLKRNQMAYQQS